MVEGGTPNTLFRRGLTKDSLVEGTEIVVDGYQAKDGSNRANGRDITSQMAASCSWAVAMLVKGRRQSRNSPEAYLLGRDCLSRDLSLQRSRATELCLIDRNVGLDLAEHDRIAPIQPRVRDVDGSLIPVDVAIIGVVNLRGDPPIGELL